MNTTRGLSHTDVDTCAHMPGANWTIIGLRTLYLYPDSYAIDQIQLKDWNRYKLHEKNASQILNLNTSIMSSDGIYLKIPME
jgi:hypothetical protein